MGVLRDSHSLAAPPAGCHEHSQRKTSLCSQPTAGGVPSPVPRGCFGRKARWSTGEAARPLRTQPRLRSHLPTRRCDLPALSHSLLAPSPPPLSCRFTFATASPQLPSSHWLHQVRCWLAPSRRGWERAGPRPLPGSSPWTSQPHCNAAYSSHLPVVIPLPAHWAVLDPIAGRGQRD